jgi:hypothetical protein
VENSGLLTESEAINYEDAREEGEAEELPLEYLHLAFTFRADLPLDIPHSAIATCVRYSFSVVVSAKTASNEVREGSVDDFEWACAVTYVTFHKTMTHIHCRSFSW